MRTVDKIVYLSEELDRNRILNGIKNLILAGALGSMLFFGSSNLNAEGTYEKSRNNVENFMSQVRSYDREGFNSYKYVKAETERIEKKLAQHNIPAEELENLKKAMETYMIRLERDAKFMSQEDKNKSIVNKYNMEAMKLIDKYNDDVGSSITKSSAYKKTEKFFNIINKTLADDVKILGNISSAALIKQLPGETTEELMQRRVDRFTELEMARLERNLFEYNIKKSDMKRIEEAIKKAYRPIDNLVTNKKEKASIFLKIYKDAIKDALKNATDEMEIEEIPDNDTHSLDDVFESTLFEEEYLSESIKGKLNKLEVKLYKIENKARKALDRGQITYDEYMKVQDFCDKLQKELVILGNYRKIPGYSRAAMKERLNKILKKADEVLNDNAFVEILKKAGCFSVFFGMLSFFLLSVATVPIAIIESFFGAGLLTNLVKKIIRRSRRINSDFKKTENDFLDEIDEIKEKMRSNVRL